MTRRLLLQDGAAFTEAEKAEIEAAVAVARKNGATFLDRVNAMDAAIEKILERRPERPKSRPPAEAPPDYGR